MEKSTTEIRRPLSLIFAQFFHFFFLYNQPGITINQVNYIES